MEILIEAPPTRRRWLVAAVAAAALTVFFALGQLARADDSLENAVKAAYLAKIGNFVDWPKTAFAGGTANLCIAGQDPFGDALDKAVASQRIADRPIAVRRLGSVARNSDCQILYAGGSGAQSADQAIEAVRGTNVFTVTDAASAGNAASIFQFVVKDSRVRFTIDDQAAAANGLTLSSELLKLALFVKGRR